MKRRTQVKQRRVWIAPIYLVLLIAFAVYALLDTFVIERSYAKVVPATTAAALEKDGSEGSFDSEAFASSSETSSSTETLNSSTTSATSVEVNQYRYQDTTIYVADVYISEGSQIMAALADNTYGKNVTEKTSDMASSAGATLAINGDYYGVRNSGYVIRNGELLRSNSAGSDQEDLVVYTDGTCAIVRESDASAQELLDAGAWQVLSFGPGLIENDTVSVSTSDEVGLAMVSNPRTAIGYVGEGHYVFVVSDGRTGDSEGLTLYELATFMHDELGCQLAYNLDGGGSSTMYYEGEVINNPTTSGHHIKEREVSDIVYVI